MRVYDKIITKNLKEKRCKSLQEFLQEFSSKRWFRSGNHISLRRTDARGCACII